jgi:ABC-type transport system substrate-binding protein
MRLRAGVLSLLVLCMPVGPAHGAGTLHPWTDPTTLRLVVAADPHGFNPIYPTNQEDDYLASLCFDLLITQDAAGRLVPDLAADTTVRRSPVPTSRSPGARSWTRATQCRTGTATTTSSV